MDHHIINLSNGIRVVLKPDNTVVSHACILINAGTRDELPHQFGMAHFIEHLLFKKTARRNTNQILNRLELVGADLNAYTTKEYTCIHASFLKEHLARVLDLFEDIVFHSQFPEIEMEKEKGVILDEIASYQDSPEDAIADDFEDLLFSGHALGHNILGTENTLKAFSRADISDFLEKNYCTDEIVVAITGNYSIKKVNQLVETIFAKLPANLSGRTRKLLLSYQAQQLKVVKPIVQTHVTLGNIAYDLYDSRKTGLMVLNNLLGGMGMSSRLNLQIREKYGIAYTIESNYTPFTDTGIFSIYYGTDADKATKAKKLVQKELKKLKEEKLGVLQIHQAKNKFIGQIALGEENRMGVLISMAKNILDYDRVNTLEEVVEKINAVTANEVFVIANEVFDERLLSELNFEPEEG
ncbi:M16 family metallopeptidase [Olivibacter domesticus]|uniref:Predicted Zn-dependent peptidase n=1 Tax=Olivibacter domesticus TaxID=407022 RepID=A0A1H7SK74_OLID1|nr:pitrilysin family protein [Olivibacter domesticus]SEL72923.1 Predicted Zn-dependent peptidase [Olivibacter domesticus]